MKDDLSTIKVLMKCPTFPCRYCKQWRVGDTIVCVQSSCEKWKKWYKEEWKKMREDSGYAQRPVQELSKED